MLSNKLSVVSNLIKFPLFKINKKIEIKDEILKSLKIINNKDNELCVSYEKNKIKIEEIINFIKTKNVEINDVITYDADLEDVFLHLTKS